MLSNGEISRYSRQLLLPEFGVAGQKKLKEAKVLVVGAGGLGCPASIYLAAAGVGQLKILDFDDVELTNLHRQITHTEERVGTSKATSACETVTKLNSSIKCEPIHVQLSTSNALDIITSELTVVLDCTDNAATRYLVNDACVLQKIPLVSASALRWEGQLTVYNYKDGPCYRCIFPQPPPPETVTNCNEGGVIGVVPGTLGTLQALEAIKVICGIGETYSGRLLLFDALSCLFRTIKLRGRNKACAVCGDSPTIDNKLIDYEAFCGSGPCDKVRCVTRLNPSNRVSVEDLDQMRQDISKNSHILIDVRPSHEFEICNLPGSVNVPLSLMNKNDRLDDIESLLQTDSDASCYVICHRGNDSQDAVLRLRELLADKYPDLRIKDVVGGLQAWTDQVDTEFPQY